MPKTDPHKAPAAPRILIENSEYWLSNMGDLAMLQVTIDRLRERWPDARIGVLTNTPALLRAYFPDAEPITPRGSRAWSDAGAGARLCEVAGPRVVGPAAIGWVTAKAWIPQKMKSLRRKSRKALAMLGMTPSPGALTPVSPPGNDRAVGPASGRMAHNTVAAARSASLVLVLGGGYLTDADPTQAHRVLDLLEHAHDLGTIAVLVGQGLGPIEDPALMARAAVVLPHVDFIGLREGRRGPELLARAGVPHDRIEVTGDDAIELSYSVRRDDLGSDIGVCLRVADYSPVSSYVRKTVGTVLRLVANELGAGLTPVIIAEYRSQDRRSTLPLIRGFAPVAKPPRRFARPAEVAKEVGRCRVMVTGAYHAAVFALAQGIPVVALTTSEYYDDKFLGLAEMFPGGLELIRLDGAGLSERLGAAIRSAWREAPAARSALRASALSQISASRSGLERVMDLVETKPRRGELAR
jgi:polysaccharide pyruvyl transferase WcaK-like protein